MATPKGMLSGSTLLSLAGYLELHQKSWRGRQKKRYWFWFDEQTCHLKYYRSQEVYQHSLFETLGTIDLRYATITPPMSAEDLAANQFQITAGGQSYTLAVGDTGEAHSWIRKLQDKREQWIRRDSAQGMTDLDRQAKKKVLQPLHERVGVVLPDTESAALEKEEPSTVRRILSRHMRLESRHSLPLEELPVYYPPSMPRSCTVTATYHPAQEHSEDLPQSSTQPSPSSPERSAETLGPESREVLQLRHEYHMSQEEVTRLQKEVLQLKERMEKKNEKIVQLNSDIDVFRESMAKSVRGPDDRELEIESLRDIIEQYKRSVKSLVDELELKKLHETEHDRKVSAEKHKVQELEKELNMFKAKYVTLLSDKFKVVVPHPVGVEEEGADAEDEVYQEELLQLLQRESEGKDVFQNYRSTFKDQYGDQHDWQSDTTVQHYLCWELYLHYTQQEMEGLLQEWMEFLKPVKNVKGKPYLDLLPSNDRVKRRDLRNLLRRGVPIQHRTRVWTSLVYRLMGRVKEVKDSTAGPGNCYYQSLLNSKNESLSEKQILLDLHRTLPNNTHFRSKGQGTPKLQNVLTAYSHHNKNVGYCQGMNLLAAIALLFLDEETTFWFLQAVIEKILPAGYFTPGLLGAQADQAVLRELLHQKLPRLSSHLDLHTIDVTLVTFNWFLTLFIDAMPTESVFRILDCFLLEGSKVLFRVALGVLKVNAHRMLSITDPVGLFQTLKEIAKHSFDIDHLLKIAFTGMEPFPSRSSIVSRHSYHYGKMKELWLLRERESKAREARNKLEKLKKQPLRSRVLASSFREAQKARRHLVWECGCVRVRGEEREEVWLCCGDRQQGRIAIISATEGQFHMKVPSNDVGSRVICVGYVTSDLVVLGTLDFNLYAFDCTSKREVWSVKMQDSVLAIESTADCTVFAALADGFVAVLQNISCDIPDSDPILVRIGSGAVPCLALGSTQQLWCGCGSTITILSSQTFEPVHSIASEELAGKVYKMETSQHGVWVSFRSSSLVSLYEARLRVKLLQVDYTSLLPSHLPFSDKLDSRVTSVMVAGHSLWLGTGKGAVLIFTVSGAVAEPEAAIAKLARASNLLEVVAEEGGERGEGDGRAGQGLVTEGLPGERASQELGAATAGPAERRDRSDHYRNRRTAFGLTLRGPSVRQAQRSPAVFQLQYENSYQLTQRESVKVLLPMCGGAAAVSCVHSVSDWAKGVQAWTCHSTPDKWSFQYLPLCPNHVWDAKPAYASHNALVADTDTSDSFKQSLRLDTPDQKQDGPASSGPASSGPSPQSKGNEDGHNSTSLRQEDEAGDEAVDKGEDEAGDEAVDEGERMEAESTSPQRQSSPL